MCCLCIGDLHVQLTGEPEYSTVPGRESEEGVQWRLKYEQERKKVTTLSGSHLQALVVDRTVSLPDIAYSSLSLIG